MSEYIRKSKADRIEAFHLFLIGAIPKEQRYALADALDRMSFFTAPASTKFHGSHEGGLFDHCLDVGKNLLLLTDKLGLKWQEPRSPRLVGMLHDLCKHDQYGQREDGSYYFRTNLALIGHGDKSVILAQRVLHEIGLSLTEEEIMCIRWHMGAYDDSKNWTNLGEAIGLFPNILFTHTADMMASRIHNI